MRKHTGTAKVAAMRLRDERGVERRAGDDDSGRRERDALRSAVPRPSRTAKSYADLLREACAQGTVEYALTTVVFLSIVVACAALWRAATDGTLGRIAAQAASHVLDGSGAIDIALY